MAHNKITHQEFLRRAFDKHGSKFDYAKTTYVDMKSKIILGCPYHGDVSMTPWDHLKGYGCGKCGKASGGQKNATGADAFVTQARIIHGDTYDYSCVIYANAHTKVKLICKKHGEFESIPTDHINNKSGCSKCASEKRGLSRRTSVDDFISSATVIHGGVYFYDKVIYTGSNNKVIVTCPKHGDWEVRPAAHLKLKHPAGCPRCAIDRRVKMRTKSQDDFLRDALEVHGDTYDYSKVEYVHNTTRVTLVCKEHGDFLCLPRDHLRGTGCRNCAQSGYRTKRPGTIYIVKAGNITKVGITNRHVKNRVYEFAKNNGERFEVLTYIEYNEGNTPLRIETEMLKILKSTYKQPPEVFDGSTECFLDVPDDVVLSLLHQLVVREEVLLSP